MTYRTAFFKVTAKIWVLKPAEFGRFGILLYLCPTTRKNMTKQHAIKIFEDRKVRTVWDADNEKWYFSVVDVVSVLTDSVDPSGYIKTLRRRDPELSKGWGQIVTPLSVDTPGGKQRMNCADQRGVFRLIQSIPSPKAEPFKMWMASVASERIDQMQDPEKSIDQAILDYKRLGYSDAWINNRLKSIEIRKELTDEWQRRGVDGTQYATLTDIITKTWSGKTTREYKNHKGLKKENLRDNMTNVELTLNMLAEASTTEISKQKKPEGIVENASVARQGGNVARVAREQLESQLGHSVISSKRAPGTIKGKGNPKQIDK